VNLWLKFTVLTVSSVVISSPTFSVISAVKIFLLLSALICGRILLCYLCGQIILCNQCPLWLIPLRFFSRRSPLSPWFNLVRINRMAANYPNIFLIFWVCMKSCSKFPSFLSHPVPLFLPVRLVLLNFADFGI
jgi:hypothetical protein